MRTVNDTVGYWAVMRLMQTGLSRHAPVSIPDGKAGVVFLCEAAARLRVLLADFICKEGRLHSRGMPWHGG